MESFIEFYFKLGLHQSEICSILSIQHNITISERHLRRILRKKKLCRRKNFTNIHDVVNFIEEQIQTHGQLHGYRWMHHKCLQNNFVVTQEQVRHILNILDPEGVNLRTRKRLRRRQYSSKGPNYLWHIDCYDKLKPFGICISGCIDGFSRKILWLRASNNTSNPRIIGAYYIETMKIIGGCPHSIRADLGTENGIVKEIQNHVRENHSYSGSSSLPPFLYGRSTANQRIEAWWSMLRKHHAQFWINLFHTLKDDGHFSGTPVEKNLIQFCFLKLIQEELDIVSIEWNTHRISGSRNSISPAGRPFMMFHTPQMYGATDYRCTVSNDVLSELGQMFDSPRAQCDKDFYDLVAIIMSEENLHMRKTPFEAVDLYLKLRPIILDIFGIFEI